MALSIKHPEADRLARELARATGESLTEAVTEAIRERLVRVAGWTRDGARAEIDRIVSEIAALPVLDPRPADDLLGYDEHGLPS